jgi:hypothetical protein
MCVGLPALSYISNIAISLLTVLQIIISPLIISLDKKAKESFAGDATRR